MSEYLFSPQPVRADGYSLYAGQRFLTIKFGTNTAMCLPKGNISVPYSVNCLKGLVPDMSQEKPEHICNHLELFVDI